MDLVKLAGWFGAVSVAAGAFGAHGLKSVPDMTDARLGAFQTGSHYALAHSVAAAALAHRSPRAAGLWLAGSAVFGGSLWLYGYSGKRWLGAVAPVGGTMLIAGWVVLALA
jgi:uncharacterized membrane protein YgdD (TMEM256/DUF423 family)